MGQQSIKQLTQRDRRPLALTPAIVGLSLEVIVSGSGSARPVPPHTEEHTGPVAGFYTPVLSSPSPSISYVLFRLSRETQHVWTRHPGGAGLPVQPAGKAATESKAGEESLRRVNVRAVVCGHHLLKQSLCGLLPLRCTCGHLFAPKQLTMVRASKLMSIPQI